MIEISIGLAVASFVAGLLTFLAPCTLPLVPAYLGFISGVDNKALADPTRTLEAKRKILRNGAAFILGFSLVFVLFGVLAGFAGTALAPYRLWLARVGGILIIIFGLFMLGAFNISFFAREKRIPIPEWLSLGKPSTSLFIGGTFALGWTPCVGPVLGSILLLAGTSSTALEGGVMLAIFSLGLSIPFLIISALFSKATIYINKISHSLRWISIVGGSFLILLGLLLATDNFGLTIEYGYRLFEFLEYDRLLNYL